MAGQDITIEVHVYKRVPKSILAMTPSCTILPTTTNQYFLQSERRTQSQLRLLHDGGERCLKTGVREPDAVPVRPAHRGEHLEANVRAVDLRGILRDGGTR